MVDKSMDPEPVLSISHLSVTRDTREILRDVSWQVRRGEHWTLLGANGSGKTSLLSVLLGYLTPTAGEVEIAGRESAVEMPRSDQQWDAWRRNIGFVSSSISRLVEPQETAFETILAGRYAMVNYWSRTDPPKADLEDAEKTLERVECGHLRQQPWMFLSQGERQRVLIGRALMAPSLYLLVLDEPCAGLDPVAREHFLGFIERLVTEDPETAPTLVLVTHHVEEIIPAISHALILKQGAMLASGTKAGTITSKNLSEAFGAPLTLSLAEDGSYRLEIEKDSRGVV